MKKSNQRQTYKVKDCNVRIVTLTQPMVQTRKEINNATCNDGYSDLEHYDNRDEPCIDILIPSLQITQHFFNSY